MLRLILFVALFFGTLLARQPVLTYSSYFGGNADDQIRAVTLDRMGNVYVAGVSESTDLAATQGGLRTSGGKIFVAKFDTGGKLIYCAFVGGSGPDEPHGVAADDSGNVYVTGTTSSANFPVTQGAFQPRRSGSFSDAFVFKLNAAGSALVYSTYLGGDEGETAGMAIAVDPQGYAYVTGGTASSRFPTTAGAFQPTGKSAGKFAFLRGDAFVTKLNSSGTALLYSTYLAGENSDSGASITVDRGGNAVVAGQTQSCDFPVTQGAFQPRCSSTYSGQDAFVVKVNTTGSGLVYGTFLHGSNEDIASAVAVDAAGNAYVGGATRSKDFPTTAGAFQTIFVGGSNEGFDAFLVKLSPSGAALVYGTYLGGWAWDLVNGISLDSSGRVLVTGMTESPNFPVTPDAWQLELNGRDDAFLAVLTPVEGGDAYSTFFGGERSDEAIGVAVSPSGRVVLVGNTSSLDFHLTPGAFQTEKRDRPQFGDPARDGFVTMLDFSESAPILPRITTEAIVNGASFERGAIAPGEVVAIFGSNLGPADLVTAQLDDAGRVATLLGGTRLFFDGQAAPLLYVRQDQMAAVIPFGVAGKDGTHIYVDRAGARSNMVRPRVTSVAPGIFTANASGRGQAAVLNHDYTVNSRANPAPKGSVIMLFATGAGATQPPSTDGALAAGILPKPVEPVRVWIGQTQAEVLYAGAAPDLVAGVVQVNAVIPPDAMAGANQVSLAVGVRVSQHGVTIEVK